MIGIPRYLVTLRSWLTWYHLLAGFAGVMLTLIYMPTLLAQISPEHRPRMGLFMLGMVALFAIVGWVGVLISMRSPWAIWIAVPLQILQIPVFAIGPFRWDFFAGGYVVPFWQVGTGESVIAGLKANLNISWGGDPHSTLIGLNIVPPIIVWLLCYKLPSIERSQSALEASTDITSTTHANQQLETRAIDEP